MARPRKTETVESDVMEHQADPNYGPVKQLVRKISTQGMSIPDLDINTIFEADDHLSKWVALGYEIKHVTYMGTDPNGSFDYHFLLIKTQ